MRIVAFSDSHGRLKRIEKLIQRTKDTCELYLFAGDNICDVNGLHEKLCGIRLIKVPGNCDTASSEPEIAVTEECGKRIILTHGHLQNVKSDLNGLKELARQNKADIVVYGHTHKRAVDYSDGVYYINPGSLAMPKGFKPPSYAVIDIDTSEVSVTIVNC